MSVFDRFIEVKRKLLRAGIDLDDLPPFAVTEEEFCELASTERFLMENPAFLWGGVFIVQGLRCMKGN